MIARERDYFLADDLSGALDAAGAFHAAGRRVRIVWTTEAWDEAPPGAVVAVTTETRNATPTAAAAVVRRTLEHGKARGARLRYKKIDSTLRGPVAAEVGAVLAVLPTTRVLFSSANPAVGRTIRDGVLLVDGVPVAETEYGRDPVSPVQTSWIPGLLGSASSDRVTIADAVTESDLAAAVERMERLGGNWVAIGSGALARPVAALHRAVPAEGRPAESPGPAPGPRLMICGSAHPANREQAARLTREFGVPSFEIAASRPCDLVPTIVAAAQCRGGAILMIQPSRVERELALQAIVLAATEAIAGAEAARIFITGGETAFALCAELGISYLDFAAELEPGLSVSRGVASGRSWRLAIKPGGFGDPQTWIRAWRGLDAS